MNDTISIEQELINKGGRDHDVIMTVDYGNDVETIEFNYFDTNDIFPRYNAIINTIRGIEDADVELICDNAVFVEEVNGSPNVNTRLLSILNDVKQMQGVTLTATLRD